MKLLGLGGLFVVLALCGCSNNKGKIENTKWTSEDTVAKGIHVPAGAVFLHFHKDGTLSGRFGNNSLTGKYVLGFGDNVTFHLDQTIANHKTHTETIVIDGDRLTMTDSDGTRMTFRKWR
jgi:hypothetical protein